MSGWQPIAIQPDARVALEVGEPEPFTLSLPDFEGPLGLLLHLIESRQLDVLSVQLADVADAYVDYLARHRVEPSALAEFVAMAAQLIEIKSRQLLPTEPMAELPVADEPDEGELRRRLIEYRTLRDASRALGERDGQEPALRREPRESDLPEATGEPIPARVLADALHRLAAIPEPEQPPTEVVPREVTIGEQIAMLRDVLSRSGRVVLQTILATCRSRTEATVTFLAMLELVRRRQVSAQQLTLFGPILLEPTEGGA